jgi:hypothetical protein
MQVGFVETMRGHLRGPQGDLPAEFRVAAISAGLRQALTTGEFALSGVAMVAPWAENAPASGTLRIDPRNRHLHYDVRFDGYALRGHKTVRLLALLETMTLLPVTLYGRDGKPLTDGELRFPMATLRPFLRSFLGLGRQREALDVVRRGLERRRIEGEV